MVFMMKQLLRSTLIIFFLATVGANLSGMRGRGEGEGGSNPEMTQALGLLNSLVEYTRPAAEDLAGWKRYWRKIKRNHRYEVFQETFVTRYFIFARVRDILKRCISYDERLFNDFFLGDPLRINICDYSERLRLCFCLDGLKFSSGFKRKNRLGVLEDFFKSREAPWSNRNCTLNGVANDLSRAVRNIQEALGNKHGLYGEWLDPEEEGGEEEGGGEEEEGGEDPPESSIIEEMFGEGCRRFFCPGPELARFYRVWQHGRRRKGLPHRLERLQSDDPELYQAYTSIKDEVDQLACEREAGGRTALQALLRKKNYTSKMWKLRRFFSGKARSFINSFEQKNYRAYLFLRSEEEDEALLETFVRGLLKACCFRQGCNCRKEHTELTLALKKQLIELGLAPIFAELGIDLLSYEMKE